DVMHAGTVTAARRHQFAGVVAVRAANDDDDLALPRQLDGGGLALFRRLANGVNEPDLGVRKSPANQGDDLSDPFNRLCGLRDHAEAGPFLERVHIRLVVYDIELL